MQIRVYYEDTDVGGVVYHSNYLNFCERARSQLFFDAGRSPILENGHFVAKHIDGSFLKSAYFGDLLNVSTTLIEIKNASLKLNQKVFRSNELLFELVITLAFLDFQGKMTKIPIREKEFFLSLK